MAPKARSPDAEAADEEERQYAVGGQTLADLDDK